MEAIDLTSELEDQQYINNITVSNLNCDTAIGIGTINLNPADRLLDIGKVVVNNMIFTPEESLKTTVHTIGVANAWIKDLVISKSKFNGCNHIVSTYVYRNSHAYVNNNEYIRDIDRVVTINDSSIEVENVFYSGCYIDVAGKCFINNTTFRGKDIIGSLVFEDSFGDQSHGIYKDDLSKSPTKIIITDCSFKDLYIYIGANTEFINCIFDNCAFFELSSKLGSGFQNFSCKFEDSKFNYVSENSASNSTGRFMSIDHLKILNCTFDGIAPNHQGVASFGRTNGVENSYINIYNSIYNVSRSSGGSNSLVLTSEYENIKLIGNYIKSKSNLVAFSDFGKEHFLLCKENNCGDNNQSIYFSLTETSSPNLSIIFDNNKMVWNSDSNYNLAAIFRLCNGNYVKNCVARNNISIEDNTETKYIYSKVIEI